MRVNSLVGDCQEGGFPKGWVHSDVPRNENWNEGTFACSHAPRAPERKTGTRVRSTKPPFYEAAPSSPLDLGPRTVHRRCGSRVQIWWWLRIYNVDYLCNGRVLHKAGAETPLDFRETFRVSPITILKYFSAVDTQTAVLVSTAEVRISAPDAQKPNFLGFLSMHSWLWFSAGRQKLFLRPLPPKLGLNYRQLRAGNLAELCSECLDPHIQVGLPQIGV